MAYVWSRYILVHCLQTGTEIWNVMGFVDWEENWRNRLKTLEARTRTNNKALTCTEPALPPNQCVGDYVRLARNVVILVGASFRHISFLVLKMKGNLVNVVGKYIFFGNVISLNAYLSSPNLSECEFHRFK